MRRDEKHGDQNYATSIALTDNNMQIAYKGTAKLEIVCQKLSLKQRLKEVLLSKRLAALFAAGVRIVTTHPNYPRSERILFVGDIFVLSQCEDFGDNDWKENLSLNSIIEKHLYCYLLERREGAQENERKTGRCGGT